MPFEDRSLLPTRTHTLIRECCNSVRSLCQRSDPLSWRKHDTLPTELTRRTQSVTIMTHFQPPPTLKPTKPTLFVTIRPTLTYPAYFSDTSIEHILWFFRISAHNSRQTICAILCFRSSPFGRSAISLRMKGTALGDSLLSSTSESRLPLPPVVRGNLLIFQSVSDSAVERETSPRVRVSFDSDRESSTSPRPSKYSSVVRFQNAYLWVLRSNGLQSFTQFLPDEKEGRREQVVHARAHPYARPLPHMSDPSCSHSLTVSPRSVVSIPAKSPSYPSIPSPSPPLSHSTHSRDATARAQQTHGDGDVEEAATLSRSDISCTCACLPLFGSARFHSMHIFVCDMPPRQFYLHVQVRLPSQHFSRVSRRKRLGRDLNFSESSMHAKR